MMLKHQQGLCCDFSFVQIESLFPFYGPLIDVCLVLEGCLEKIQHLGIHNHLYPELRQKGLFCKYYAC